MLDVLDAWMAVADSIASDDLIPADTITAFTFADLSELPVLQA